MILDNQVAQTLDSQDPLEKEMGGSTRGDVIMEVEVRALWHEPGNAASL